MSESKEQRRVTLQVHLGLIEEQIKHLLDLDSQLTNPEEQRDALEQVKGLREEQKSIGHELKSLEEAAMNLIDVHKTFATDEQWRLCAASVRRAREPRACASPKRKRSRSTRGRR